MNTVNVLQNDKGEVRVTFELGPKAYAVVKTFGAQTNDLFTVKFWIGGDIKKTQSFWSTKTPVGAEKAKVLAAQAADMLKRAYAYFGKV